MLGGKRSHDPEEEAPCLSATRNCTQVHAGNHGEVLASPLNLLSGSRVDEDDSSDGLGTLIASPECS